MGEREDLGGIRGDGLARSGAELARVAPEPRVGPARGADILFHQRESLALQGALHLAEARNNWVRDWSVIPDPLGDEALPLVMELYGWLS